MKIASTLIMFFTAWWDYVIAIHVISSSHSSFLSHVLVAAVMMIGTLLLIEAVYNVRKLF